MASADAWRIIAARGLRQFGYGLLGVALAVALGLPLVVSGGLKVIYDLSLWAVFRHIRPPEEARD